MHNNENEQESDFDYAFINEFKKWLEDQLPLEENEFKVANKKLTNEKIVGIEVLSRIGIKRLNEKIADENQDIEMELVGKLAKEFKESGGTVVESEDLSVMVEVASGKFAIPKAYTKKK